MEVAGKLAGAAAGVNPWLAATVPYALMAGRELWNYAQKGKSGSTVSVLRRRGKYKRRGVKKYKGRRRRKFGLKRRRRNGTYRRRRGATLYQKVAISKAMTAPYTVTRMNTVFREAQVGKKAIFATDYDSNDMLGVSDSKNQNLFSQDFRDNISDAVSDNQKLAITDYTAKWTFRNLSKNRIFLTLYTCKTRHDYNRVATDYANLSAADLNTFIASQYLQSDTTPVGTLNKITPGTKLLDIPNVGQMIHVLKAKKYSLDAGQCMVKKWKKKDHYYSQWRYQWNGTLAEDRFFVIELEGDLIHDNANATPITTSLAQYKTLAPATAKIAIECEWGASMWRVGTSLPTKLSYTNYTTPTTNPGAVDVNTPTITTMDATVST